MDITFDYQTPEDAWLSGLTAAIQCVVPNGTPYTETQFRERYTNDWPELDWPINLGREQPFGIWHIVGFRMGIYLVLLTEWDITLINSDQALAEMWASIMDDDPEIVAATVADPLARELGINIVMMGPAESLFFQRYCS